MPAEQFRRKNRVLVALSAVALILFIYEIIVVVMGNSPTKRISIMILNETATASVFAINLPVYVWCIIITAIIALVVGTPIYTYRRGIRKAETKFIDKY